MLKNRMTALLAAATMTVALGAATAPAATAAESSTSYVVTTAAMPQNVIDSAVAGGGMTTMASPVGSTWNDHRGRKVVLRIDAQNKLWTKHNVNRNVPRVATQYPDSSRAEAGTSWEYFTTFQQRNGTTITRTQQVRTVVDFRNVDGNPQGVITSYCVGITRCPDWINQVVG
ncbi:hypothetical protein GRS96_19130 (plasmid) [Rathayibacter sp. VKM Ac-2803]|jgi:hypothetical protein|uniref:hypothetical protein n=1 Tax=unclassified Rathayibacter TaxID=2609250 RepID=UPI000CE824D6|nr:MULTISPECIES: hypothetical protein [unclassified Rathayibacter]MWV51388.1 hypothetical protein [Rathayibacter sp. VKM Ac-2803]PPF46318.1 hypothetical protein C5E14_11350 [Rathayibacter sp. AY1A1]PPH01830.1 hypothetical protein C5C44_13620 [Rathayibacter sp. AY1F6]